MVSREMAVESISFCVLSSHLLYCSSVFFHEIPGGQYTNLRTYINVPYQNALAKHGGVSEFVQAFWSNLILLATVFQSKQLGLSDKWTEIKQKYAEANIILGDIPKVTPSSKVVGDLAQFMVAQNLDATNILEQADTLAFPDSVVNYLRGDIGVPPGGFPEPLRTKVLEGRGLTPIEGRPGAVLAAYNFTKSYEQLCKKFGEDNVSEKDVLSDALYPQVFSDFKEYQALYGEVGKLPTNAFLHPFKVGEEVTITLRPGKDLIVQLLTIDSLQEDGTRNVIFKVNGEDWYMPVTDHSAETSTTVREKAKEANQVGSPMPGVIVGLKVHAGLEVKEGEPVATLSAMKMETSIPATVSGIVSRVVVNVGDKVDGDDLILEIN